MLPEAVDWCSARCVVAWGLPETVARRHVSALLRPSELPFELTPNPKYLYLTPKHREALSNLEYGLFRRSR